MLEEKKTQLLETYRKWSAELNESCSQLVNEHFSHPYYLHIPDHWYQSQYRILIVGEEGYGEKKFNAPIEEVQAFNRDYLNRQLGIETQDNYTRSSSAFWKRIRAIATLFNGTSFAITWTNLDKIHRSGKGNCRLTKKDREALHQTPTHILAEEIALLQPTHVIYFGWYGISLKEEFQNAFLPVFTQLYPNDLGDSSGWEPKKIKVITEANTHHIFTYHPNWGQRQKDGYEDCVINCIRETLE